MITMKLQTFPVAVLHSGASQTIDSQGHMEPPPGLWQYDCRRYVKL